jgi:hypothetical protein
MLPTPAEQPRGLHPEVAHPLLATINGRIQERNLLKVLLRLDLRLVLLADTLLQLAKLSKHPTSFVLSTRETERVMMQTMLARR